MPRSKKKSKQPQRVITEPAVMVPIDDVKPYPGNPRSGRVPEIMQSIERNGFYGAITAQKSTGFICRGNHTHEALRRLGWTEVPVEYGDFDDATARRILLIDNRLPDMSTYNPEALVDLLRTIEIEDDWSGTGYDPNDLDELLAEMEAEERRHEVREHKRRNAKVEAVAAEEAQKKWGVEFGDVYQARSRENPNLVHLIACGDSTDEELVGLLFGSDTCDQLITDPPWGVDYGEKNELLNKANAELFLGAIAPIPWSEYNTMYSFLPANALLEWQLALRATGAYFAMPLVLVKNRPILGWSDYKPQHEIIAYGWNGKHQFHGPRDRSTVIHVDKAQKNRLHPTEKPLDVLEQLMRDGSTRGELVYDPFGGSGTLAYTAERLGRRAISIEFVPDYVAVTLERLVGLGLDPVKVPTGSDGRPALRDEEE